MKKIHRTLEITVTLDLCNLRKTYQVMLFCGGSSACCLSSSPRPEADRDLASVSEAQHLAAAASFVSAGGLTEGLIFVRWLTHPACKLVWLKSTICLKPAV